MKLLNKRRDCQGSKIQNQVLLCGTPAECMLHVVLYYECTMYTSCTIFGESSSQEKAKTTFYQTSA